MIEFGVGADDAWKLTPQEWVMLYRVKAKSVGAPTALTTEECAEMHQQLEEWIAEEEAEAAAAALVQTQSELKRA